MGSLTLTPEFDPDETEYTTETTNTSNKLTYEKADEDATVTVKLNGVVQTSSTITWAVPEEGETEAENVLTLEVVDGDLTKTYTIEVTKT